MKLKAIIICFIICPVLLYSQVSTTRDIYYAGINPVAPFTGIRSSFTSRYLPVVSNLETGASLFIGKIWNGKYNVETRLSYGSPYKSAKLFLVQSGFTYCFNKRSPMDGLYAGLFVKLNSLNDKQLEYDRGSVTAYWCAGRRFTMKRFFADIRISQQFMSVKWTNEPGNKAAMGFHPSIYEWKSPYVPYVGIGVGYLLNRK